MVPASMRGIKPLVIFLHHPNCSTTACPSFNQSCTYCRQLYVLVAPFTTARDTSLTADFFQENTWRNANHPSLYPHMGVSENSVPLNPMVCLIIIPFLNGYFIGNIPYFHPYCWCFGDSPNFFAVAVLVFSQHVPSHDQKRWTRSNMINMVIYPFIRILFTIYVPVVRIL